MFWLYYSSQSRVFRPTKLTDTWPGKMFGRLPGKLVWQGDITALANDGAVVCNGQEFRALEPLFLHLTGERYADLKWL